MPPKQSQTVHYTRDGVRIYGHDGAVRTNAMNKSGRLGQSFLESHGGPAGSSTRIPAGHPLHCTTSRCVWGGITHVDDHTGSIVVPSASGGMGESAITHVDDHTGSIVVPSASREAGTIVMSAISSGSFATVRERRDEESENE
jgi:hypothetical protein